MEVIVYPTSENEMNLHLDLKGSLETTSKKSSKRCYN